MTSLILKSRAETVLKIKMSMTFRFKGNHVNIVC